MLDLFTVSPLAGEEPSKREARQDFHSGLRAKRRKEFRVQTETIPADEYCCTEEGCRLSVRLFTDGSPWSHDLFPDEVDKVICALQQWRREHHGPRAAAAAPAAPSDALAVGSGTEGGR